MNKLKRGISLLLVAVMILPLGTFAFGEQTDISNHWAKEEIQYLIGKEVVSGYSDGNFKPDQSITRAEFIKIINNVFAYSEKAEAKFSDVKEGDWFYDEIRKATKAGYIGGYNDGTIKPNNPITRQEVSKIMGMVFDLDETKSKSANSFADSSKIGDWAKGYVSILKDKGYISGYSDKTFRPTNPITRAEAVKIITNASGNIINLAGEYSDDAAGNVLVNTSDVELKDMNIKGDLYLVEGIGEGDVILDNVVVEGSTYVRGGGENSIKIKNSKLGQIIIRKVSRNVRLVLEETTISSIVADNNTRLLVGEGAKVGSIKVVGKSNIEVAKGAEVGKLEVEARNTEIKAEGKIDSLVSKEDVKVNDEVVGEGKEIKVEDGKVKEVKKDTKPKPAPAPSGGGGGGGGGGGRRDDDKDDPKPPEKERVSAISVEGVPVVGQTLTATTTPSRATVNYQWQFANDGDYEDIEGATEGTYTLEHSDVGKFIRVKVTGTGNYRGTVISDPVGPIEVQLEILGANYTYKDDLWGSISATGYKPYYVDVEVMFNKGFSYIKGNLKASYWTKDANGNFVEIQGTNQDGTPYYLRKDNSWDGAWVRLYDKKKVTNKNGKYDFTDFEPDVAYGTAVSATWVPESWYKAIYEARDNGQGVWVKIEATDNVASTSSVYAPIAAPNSKPWAEIVDTSWYDESKNEFTINTARQLAGLAELVNKGNDFSKKKITLGSDIDLLNREWVPIGTETRPFKGNFNGNKKTISNLKIDASDAINVGLFGYVNGGSLTNVNFAGVNINAKEAVGSLVGNVRGTKPITNVNATGLKINSTHWTGGLIGYSYANVSDCSVDNATVTLAYDTDKGDNGDKAGGIIGYQGEGNSNNHYIYQNCTVDNVKITGVRDVGGLVGASAHNVTYVNCHVANSEIRADNSTYEHKEPYAGGVIGRAVGAITIFNCTASEVVVNSYYDNYQGEIVGGPADNVSTANVLNQTKGIAYDTIQAAIGEAEGNDTILVGEKEFNEEIHIEKPIQLIGSGIGKTTLSAASNDSKHIIWLGKAGSSGYGEDLSGIVIEGFTINSPIKAEKDISSIYLTAQGSEGNEIVIRNNEFLGQDAENQAIAVLTPYSPEIKHVKIADNQISDMKYGMYFNSMSNAEITGNTIDKTIYSGIIFYGKAEFPCDNIVVTNNTLTDISSAEKGDFDTIYYAGISFYHYGEEMTIEGNTFDMLNDRPDMYYWGEDALADGKVINATQKNEYDSIQAAIDEASEGNTILVGPGNYAGFAINKNNLTVKAVGDVVISTVRQEGTIGGGGDVGILVNGATGVVIDGFTVKDESQKQQSMGVTVFKSGTVTVSESTFENLARGIYANSNADHENFKVTLVATGNTFKTEVGIGGTENTALTAVDNVFQTTIEAIGIGPSATVEVADLYGGNNKFNIKSGDYIVDYRDGTTTKYDADGKPIENGDEIVIDEVIEGGINGAGKTDEAVEQNDEISVEGDEELEEVEIEEPVSEPYKYPQSSTEEENETEEPLGEETNMTPGTNLPTYGI